MLLIIDHDRTYVRPIRSALTWVVLPLQYAANWPLNITHWAENAFSTRSTLLETNTSLRNQILMLQLQLQRQLMIEQENTQLRALLESSKAAGGRVLIAELLAVNNDPFLSELTLNKGLQEGIYVGQPVMDAQGVMGQVIAVNRLTSRVLLLDDARSAIPVQIYRNGIRAIATGRGAVGNLALLHVPETADVKIGDLLVTSGLDDRFPAGYPVGTIIEVQHNPGETFASILAKPNAHLNRSREMLLVWPDHNDAALWKRDSLIKSGNDARAGAS
ncbi:MAG: rod shape-determining protein MreC [Gammaproteobacteria bacterium]|nr:rod shape-determining protein MreC [Gammaproteobacteria bacterium]